MYPKLLSEFLGTFWLVLGGCGSAVLAAAFPNLGIGFVGGSQLCLAGLAGRRRPPGTRIPGLG